MVDEGPGALGVELVDVDVEAYRGDVAVELQRAQGDTLIFVPPVKDGRRAMVVSIGPTGTRTLPTTRRPSQAPSSTTATRPRAGTQGAAVRRGRGPARPGPCAGALAAGRGLREPWEAVDQVHDGSRDAGH
ncbi:hypothetical protein ACFQZ0_18130 [Streptomyces erythrogriseus]